MEHQHTSPVPVAAQEAEPSSLVLILTLAVAGFFSGLILVVAYFSTLPIIEQNKEEALQEAIYRVVPGCRSYEVLVLKNDRLEKAQGEEAKKGDRIFLGYDEKKSVVGFAIPASEPGFADVIKIIYGYQADGKIIVGFEVLENKETPGLGDKIIKDKNFVGNFKALSVEPQIEATKNGSKTKPNQVETITGATISSKAVVRALQKAMARWQTAIDGYMQQNNLTYNQTQP